MKFKLVVKAALIAGLLILVACGADEKGTIPSGEEYPIFADTHESADITISTAEPIATPTIEPMPAPTAVDDSAAFTITTAVSEHGNLDIRKIIKYEDGTWIEEIGLPAISEVQYGAQILLLAYPGDYSQIDGLIEFVGWFEDDILISSNVHLDFIVNSNRNLYAKFALYEAHLPDDVEWFAVTTNIAEGGHIARFIVIDYRRRVPTQRTEFPYGTILELDVWRTTNDSYFQFVGWYENDELISNQQLRYTITVTESRNLYAQFNSVQGYGLRAHAYPNTGGTVIGGNDVFSSGEQVTLTAVANEGYVFVGWYSQDPVRAGYRRIGFDANPERTVTIWGQRGFYQSYRARFELINESEDE